MIWLGRLISVPVFFIFTILLLATLLMMQVNDTFLNPEYYPNQLREADFYNFVLNDLLIVAIDEERERERRDRDEEERVEQKSGQQENDFLLKLHN